MCILVIIIFGFTDTMRVQTVKHADISVPCSDGFWMQNLSLLVSINCIQKCFAKSPLLTPIYGFESVLFSAYNIYVKIPDT